MSTLNALFRGLFDGLLAPFAGLHPLVGITVVALLTTALILLVLKWTSNQERIEAVKRKMHAGLFEIRLFNDEPVNLLKAQGSILRHNATYLGLWLIPLLWLLTPVGIIVGQLHHHYAFKGFEPGDVALVEVTLAGEPDLDAPRPTASLSAPTGFEVEAGPAWSPAEGAMTWRVRATESGKHALAVSVGGESFEKEAWVTTEVRRRSPVRAAGTLTNQLLYPAESPLPKDGPVEKIELTYPVGDAGVTGWDSELTWMGLFFLLTIVFAFALRGPLGVTF